MTVNAEDGADGDVDVDVGRSIKWIEQDDVVAVTIAVRVDGDGLGVLFRSNQTTLAAALQGQQKLVMSECIHLLLHLALDVDLPGVALNVDEAGAAHVAVNDLCRNADVPQQARKRAR